MQADGDGHAEQDGRVPPGAVPRLDDAAGEFYADLPLSPLLHRVLTHSRRLLGTVAGSISLVQHDRERYFKVAEYGTSCRLGQHFTPEEGVTGQVISRRRPVILPSYREVRVGHLPAGDPAGDGAVAAVPIWWRGEVVGANVAFAGRRRRFTADEVDELEMLTQVAAAAIVRAGAADPSLAHLIRSHRRRHAEAAGVQTVVTQAGSVRPVSRAVAKVAVDLVAVAGGGMTVERVPGWGTLVRADFPYLQASSPDAAAARPSPFTPRELEVLGLLGHGLSDREVAARLVISPKTVEKHVGAVLRKTGTTSRTAAVLQAMERGWLPPVTDHQD